MPGKMTNVPGSTEGGLEKSSPSYCLREEVVNLVDIEEMSQVNRNGEVCSVPLSLLTLSCSIWLFLFMRSYHRGMRFGFLFMIEKQTVKCYCACADSF